MESTGATIGLTLAIQTAAPNSCQHTIQLKADGLAARTDRCDRSCYLGAKTVLDLYESL